MVDDDELVVVGFGISQFLGVGFLEYCFDW